MAADRAERVVPQVLLLSRFAHPSKDLVAATLAGVCKARGIDFDVYYAAHRGGGLFSHHGSTLLGGRHHEAVAQALLRFPTTVVRLGEVSVFGALVRHGAARVVEAPDDEPLVATYERCLEELGAAVPREVVAVQTAGLPAALAHGIAQYAFPDVVNRAALAVPLELGAAEIGRLAELGVRQVWTVAATGAATEAWRRAGLAVGAADEIDPGDTYFSFTFRVARRWLAGATGIDLCEPFLASSWLPFCVREERLQVTGEEMAATTAELAPLVAGLANGGGGERVVYGRWGGGAIGGATDDEDLFPLSRRDIAFQVIEPVRPALSVLARHPEPLPQPAAGPFDLEPSDDELRRWAAKGRILVTLVTHSGELSHDDAVVNTIDVCAATGVKAGIGVHAQRYAFNPHGVEPMHVPTEEGGVLGLCEPVLHSGGLGILAEGLASPAAVAGMMREARERIARLAGERFAPRGVYCYLDAVPGRWAERPEALWRAIAAAGFAYVVSSVGQNEDRVLFRDGDFVVLPQCGCSKYPYSPFMRVDRPIHLLDAERRLVGAPGPAWMIGVLDIPLYGYSAYLTLGDPSRGVRLGEFVDYVRGGGESGRLISATPHTIARYARLGDERR